jgi:hypothetical protein
MSTALLTAGRWFHEHGDEDDRRFHEHGDEEDRRLDDPGGPTLDDVISRAWEVLRADVPAACPACGGELLPRESAGAGVVGGRCSSCGATLS